MREACAACITRMRVTAELGGVLDRLAPRRERLLELLSLPDQKLIAAIGGSRRARLLEWSARAETGCLAVPRGGAQLCRHADAWPAALGAPWAPATLTLLGGGERLTQLLARPVVAFLDSPEASDYGIAMAASLARGVSAAGATVAATLNGPIASAAHEGAAATGASLAVCGNGLDPVHPAPLAELVLERGCIVSELPWGRAGRVWGNLAAARVVAGIATVAILIECREDAREMWAARLCTHLGAVPGLVTSPLAQGPHAALADGARLIGRAEDVLELLHDAGAERLAPAEPGQPDLPPALRRVAELVGAGADTAERVAATSAPEPGGPGGTWSVLAALGRLEISGALTRTEHGRWVRRDPASGAGA